MAGSTRFWNIVGDTERYKIVGLAAGDARGASWKYLDIAFQDY